MRVSGSCDLPADAPPPSLLLLQPTRASNSTAAAAQARRPSLRVRGFVSIILTRLRGRLHQRRVRWRNPPSVLSPTECPASTPAGAKPPRGGGPQVGRCPVGKLFRRDKVGRSRSESPTFRTAAAVSGEITNTRGPFNGGFP